MIFGIIFLICISLNLQAAVLDFQLQKTSTQTQTAEWTQHAHDAQHTGYTANSVPMPWRWKWQWNGSDNTGKPISGKEGLPRCVQPVTGGGRVYIARGQNGVIALNETTGAVLWTVSPGGNINSTVAYDIETGSLFVVSSNGTLYKLNPSNGQTIASYSTGASSNLPLPACVIDGRVFISMGNYVDAVNKTTMQRIWRYDAGSTVQTPPAYSPSRNCVVVCTADLNVHAINNSDGTRKWRNKPSVHTPGDPNEYSYGWPVIAEVHGLVLVRQRQDWNLLWYNTFENPDNAVIRQNLINGPQFQCHFALDLDDGTVPFVCNNGQGGFGDGGYMPLGGMPIVKVFPDGSEVVFQIIRGDNRWDARWDSHFGEMVLDNTTISGLQAGYVRWIKHGNSPGEDTYLLTDEQPFISMAGNHIFGSHWIVTYAIEEGDRSASYGTFNNKIPSTNLSHAIVSQGACGPCSFSTRHYCQQSLDADPDCGRIYPGGFYVCYNSGAIYDTYWTNYGCVVVSNNQIIVRDTCGSVFCLENGDPLAMNDGEKEVMFAMDKEPVIIGKGSDEPIEQVISYEDARKFIGKKMTVEGVIKYVFNNGKTVLLGFNYPHSGYFKAQIPKDYWDKFGKNFYTARTGRNLVGLYYEGQIIRVKGKISYYQGDPAIYVTSPDQIEIIGSEYVDMYPEIKTTKIFTSLENIFTKSLILTKNKQ